MVTEWSLEPHRPHHLTCGKAAPWSHAADVAERGTFDVSGPQDRAAVINAYLSATLGIDPVLFFTADYAGISRVLAARSGTRTVRSLNETAHVRELLPLAGTPR